ncbi:hypothetical protein D1835_06815, partial [Enterococcus asini]|nr:hypothetical protein [Enterococcus asini]
MAKKQRSSRKQQTNLVIKCLIVGMFLAGIGVFSYPFFVDSLNNYGTCNSLVNSRLDYLFSSPQIVEESS